VLVVSLGVDTYKNDPNSTFQLDGTDFVRVTLHHEQGRQAACADPLARHVGSRSRGLSEEAE